MGKKKLVTTKKLFKPFLCMRQVTTSGYSISLYSQTSSQDFTGFQNSLRWSHCF